MYSERRDQNDDSSDPASERTCASGALRGKRTSPTRVCASGHTFEELCLPMYDELIRFALRLVDEDASIAEEVVQEAMIRAMRAWSRWRPIGEAQSAARAWLYRVVHNAFNRRYRHEESMNRRHIKVAATMRSDGMAGYSWDLREMVDSHVGDEVLAAFGALGADRRRVVILHYLEGLSCEEIAAQLGVPRNTVFTRLARARRTLQVVLAQYAGTRRIGPEKRVTVKAVTP